MDNSKPSRKNDIPTKIIKANVDIFSKFLHNEFNKSLDISKFPNNMKLADVTPVFKKGNRFDKENYRPVSILSNQSKIFEKCIYKQILNFFDSNFSKYQCGFRKGHSAQQSLIALLEKWRSRVDQGMAFGALLTDLSKAFDCLPLYLLVAKLHAYGFNINAAKLIYDYLTNRKQRTKIGNKIIPFEDIKYGVPQGSILGPFLFNIYLCDLFFAMETYDIASYADDTTPYVFGENNDSVIQSLEDCSVMLFKWFRDNQMQGNPDKCHVLMSSKTKENINVNGILIESSLSEKLLGINIDNGLNFDKHISNICGKARAKVSAVHESQCAIACSKSSTEILK